MDKYDKDIQFLLVNPDKLPKAWYDPDVEPGGGLFQYLGPRGSLETFREYGCPTMVKRGIRGTPLSELTNKIRNDKRIPADIPTGDQINPITLQAFADYQKWADRTFRKKVAV